MNAVLMNPMAGASEEDYSHRVYKRAGCFNLTAVVAIPATDVNESTQASISQSWLPLSNKILSLNHTTGFKLENVIPVLSDRIYNRVAPLIDAYAFEHNLIVQPVLFFYRPPALAKLLATAERKEDRDLVKSLPSLSRKQALSDRIFVDITVQTENQLVLIEMRNMCLQVLSQSGLNLPAYCTADNARIVLSNLLMDFPFLVHHVFNTYPNLVLLRHKARINGRIDSINHIRYDKSSVFEMELDKLYRKSIQQVTL
jgi:hypothetical protein